ncbi:MAG: cation:proton antiporter [bacterium]
MDSATINQLTRFHEWFMVNQVADKELYLIGAMAFLALITIIISKKFKIPIVVGYVFLGIILSPDIVGLLPVSTLQIEWYEFSISALNYIPNIALTFIAFTIGSELSIRMIRRLGKSIAAITIIQGLAAYGLVVLAVWLVGQPLYIALLLGAIASATAPAATVMVLEEYNAEGPLTSMIMAVVGIDDALALLIFSLTKPLALMLHFGDRSYSFETAIVHPMIEITLSIALGLILGYISQRYIVEIENKSKKIMALVSTLIGSSAVALFFNLSPLLTNMSVGFAFRNFPRRNPGIQKYVDTMTTPLYALFFILAGTEIRFGGVFSKTFLFVAGAYLLARVIGKYGGSYLGALLSGSSDTIRNYIGLGLFPQSGVAIALAYIVQRELASTPDVGLLIFNTLLVTAAITEIFGPLATRYAIKQAGELNEIP